MKTKLALSAFAAALVLSPPAAARPRLLPRLLIRLRLRPLHLLPILPRLLLRIPPLPQAQLLMQPPVLLLLPSRNFSLIADTTCLDGRPSWLVRPGCVFF